MRPVIRFAQAADDVELARLRWHSRSAHEQDREDLAGFTRRFLVWRSAPATVQHWHAAVAQRGDTELFGCMYLQTVETVPVPGTRARAWGYVTHAFVAEDARGAGVGGDLLALLVSRARELQLMELLVWPSNRAISLYVRAGFRSPEALRAGHDPEEASYVLPLVEDKQ